MPYPFSSFLASSLLLASATSVVAVPLDWVGTACASNIDCRDFNCDMSAYTSCGGLGDLENVGSGVSQYDSYKCDDYCNTNTGNYDLFVSCSGRCVHGKCQEGFRCSSHGEPNCNDVCVPGEFCNPNDGGYASLCVDTCEANTVCSSLNEAACSDYPGGICEWSTPTGPCRERVQCELINGQGSCKGTTDCWWFENECDDANDGKACYKAAAHHQCEVEETEVGCKGMGCRWKDNSQCSGFKNENACNGGFCHWMGVDDCAAYTKKGHCKKAGCKWKNGQCKKKCTGMCSGRW